MKPIHLDGFLILITGGLPGFVAMFGSDDAAKYISPAMLFYCRNGTAILGMMVAALIAFRSKQYALFKSNGGARPDDVDQPKVKTEEPPPK